MSAEWHPTLATQENPVSRPRLMNPGPSPELVKALVRLAHAERSACAADMISRAARFALSLVRAKPDDAGRVAPPACGAAARLRA